MKKRDQTLDILRGFAMSWVILVHCAYWLQFFQSPNAKDLKSLILIEMPLFFFISGASFTLMKPQNYGQFLIKRGKRILIPYWCYVIVCILLAFLKLSDFKFFQFGMILPIQVPNFGLLFVSGALWFIWPFLLVTLTLPFLKVYFDHSKNIIWRVFIVIVMIAIITYMDFYVQNHMQIKSWILYSLFSYLGFFYQDLKKESKRKENCLIAIGFLSLLAVILLGVYQIYPFDMQFNKFQYNTMFVLYNLAFLSFLFIFLNFIMKIFQKLYQYRFFHFFFEPYKKNCYTIYLFHPIAFLVLYGAVAHFGGYGRLLPYQYFIFPIYFLITWIGCSLVGRIFSFVETPFWKKFKLLSIK